MRQVILTSFSQDTDLVTKTATAFLKFNNGELSIPVTQDALTEVIKFMAGVSDTSPTQREQTFDDYLDTKTSDAGLYRESPDGSYFTDHKITYEEGGPVEVVQVEPSYTDVQSLMNKYRNMDQINNYPPPMSKEERKLYKNDSAPPYRDPFEGPSETTIGRYNENTGGVVDEDGFAQF